MVDKEEDFVEKEEGATMVEYCLLIALVVLIAVAAVRYVGTTVSQKFSSVSSAVGTT